MFEIRGRYATAECHAASLSNDAMSQVMAMLNQPFAAGQRVVLMPDAHAGKGCVVGTTMTVTDKICPNLVGTDIGCGMYVARLATSKIDLKAVDEACHTLSANGIQGYVPNLRCPHTAVDAYRVCQDMATLGGGNHFVEVDSDGSGRFVLVIHSGSRSLGRQVATYWQQVAESRREHSVPKGLAWLEGDDMKAYLADVETCVTWAKLSREAMAARITSAVDANVTTTFHAVHNYVDAKRMVLRKGAISAEEGELSIVPLNMADGALLVCGRGNDAWNRSAPHGAGRAMSRAQAKATLSLAEYARRMHGIYTTTMDASTLDESPSAYKPAHEILEAIEETADIVDMLTPVYNYKSAGRAKPAGRDTSHNRRNLETE